MYKYSKIRDELSVWPENESIKEILKEDRFSYTCSYCRDIGKVLLTETFFTWNRLKNLSLIKVSAEEAL